ncbi:hypothetical protein [Ruegeria sp. HKCCA5014]|uniref:hypothetical protein n=1 Tax=Ruegeria sp. HKCCA5014 TaxID=2682980 RepID=UPI0014894642|nr:hypothetical protein [Ruegeria sp. HKCCA5014]
MSRLLRQGVLAASLLAAEIIGSLSWSEHILAFVNAIQQACDNIWRNVFGILGVTEYPDPVLLTFLILLLAPWFASALRDQPQDLSRVNCQKLFHDKFIAFLIPQRSILAEPQTFQTLARDWLEWIGSAVTLFVVVWVFDMWTYAILVVGLVAVLLIGRRIENSFHENASSSRELSDNEKMAAAVASFTAAWVISLPLTAAWLVFNIAIGKFDFANFDPNSWTTPDYVWAFVMGAAMVLLVHCAFFEKRYFCRFGSWMLRVLILAKLVDYGDQFLQKIIVG